MLITSSNARATDHRLTSQARAESQAKPPSPEQRKPLQESWVVGDTVFGSTRELVGRRGDVAAGGVHATYEFRTRPNEGPFTAKEKLKNAAGTALVSAVSGGLIGAAGSAFLVGATALGDFVSLLGGGQGRGLSKLVLAAPVIAGALIGAGVGIHKGYQAEGPAIDGKISGVLKNTGDELHFYPNGDIQRDINLNQFQNAEVASTIKPPKQGYGVVGNTLIGATVAAATVPALLVPVVGLGAGAYVGSTAGEAFDERTALGGGIGLALGVASTVAAVTVANVYGTGSLAYVAAGLGVVGGALGHAVLSKTNQRREIDFGSQWWNDKTLPV